MTNQKKEIKQKTFRKFLKFSGIGVQLGVTMYLASLLGDKVDGYFNYEKPWGTLFLVILALFIFIVSLIKQLNKLNND